MTAITGSTITPLRACATKNTGNGSCTRKYKQCHASFTHVVQYMCTKRSTFNMTSQANIPEEQSVNQIYHQLAILHKHPHLHPYQTEILQALIQHQHSFAIFPTGQGKSDCYALLPPILDYVSYSYITYYMFTIMSFTQNTNMYLSLQPIHYNYTPI